MASEVPAGAGDGHIPPTDAILFILVCFSIGIFIRLCLKWTKVPYTAMLLLWGLAIGFLQLANPATEAFTNTLKLWLSMEPHLLLLVFLPIIGFSAAIGQEPHMLRKSWVQIMVLAWPGVVIQFLLIALCAKYAFPYNWTWPESLLFGAMLSATDPVAVVAVLQEVGASQKLACVIDGESLMNDGSALVIFLLLQKIVEGEHVSVAGGVAQFCLLAVVGMLLGIAFGALTSWLLDNIFRDATLTTIVTLVSAYSSYYVADRLVGASGLLAVVCNGFTMSLIGGRQITMRVEDAMHSFWGVLEWAANTILFVWMGIVLAIVLPPSHQATAITNQPIHLEGRDAAYVILLYVWLQIARAVLLLVCWIPFNFTGYPLTWRSAIVMVWGGLRGAVGMVMALFIFLDTKIHDESFKSYCIFYMGTMAFFTVLINGGTCKAVLQYLGFMSYTPEQLGTLQHVIEDMDDIREKRLAELQPDEVLGEPEPDAVNVWSRLPTADVLAQAAANTVRPALNPNSPASHAAVAMGLDPQLLYDYRCRVLHMVKAHYAEVYNQHQLTTLQARTLQSVTDAALDEAGEGLMDWKMLEPSCRLRGLPRRLQAWRLHRLSVTLVQATTYSQSLSNLTLLVGFIHAHRHAQEVLKQHIRAVTDVHNNASGDISGSRSDDESMPGKISPYLGTAVSLEGVRGGSEALVVLRESEEEVTAALESAKSITRSHPSLPAWLRSKLAAGEILTEQHEFLQHLAEAGLVQPRELLLLEDLMHDQFRALLQSNTGIAAAVHYSRSRPPLNLIPLFDSLQDEEAEAIMQHCSKQAQMQIQDIDKRDNPSTQQSMDLQWRVFYPEQVIAHHSSRIDYIVVITKGSVRMRFPVIDQGPHARNEEHVVVASVGDALGVCELMLGLPRMAELTAESMVQALLVPTPTFMQLLNAVPGIMMRAWQATAAQLAAQHHHILGKHKQLAPLNMFFRGCTVEKAEPGDVFEVPHTALLLTGRMQVYIPAKDAAVTPVTAAAITAATPSSSGSLTPDAVAGGSPTGSFNASYNKRCGNGGDQQPALNETAPASSVNDKSLTGALWSGLLPSPSVTRRHKQSAAADVPALIAPVELPPGEYLCVIESILFQVPWGPHIPTYQETATYQAQVLSKGSIDLGSRSGSVTGASSGDLGDLAKLSSRVLSRISKGLTRVNSDNVPRMPHLQTALDKMRQERAAAGLYNLRKRSREVLSSKSLHTLYEAPGHEPEAISRLRKTSVGSVSTPTSTAACTAATAAAAVAGQADVHQVVGDIEMGTAGATPFAVGAAEGSSPQQGAHATEDAQGNSSDRTAAADSAVAAAVLPRALDVLQQHSAAHRLSRGYKHTSLQ